MNSDSRWKLHIEDNGYYSLALLFILYYPLFNAGLSALFKGLSFPGWGVVYWVVVAIEVALIYGALLRATYKNALPTIIVYGLLVTLYLLTVVVYPENASALLGTGKDTFLICIPGMLLAYALNSYEELLDYMQRFAPVIIICGVLYVLFSGMDQEGYSMWLGYQVIIPTMVLLWKYFHSENGKVVSLLFVLGGFIIITLKGSRGPIVVLIAYFVFLFIKYRFHLDKKQAIEMQRRRLYRPVKIGGEWYSLWGLFFVVLIVVALVYLTSNIETYSALLYGVVRGLGYDSRTLRVLSLKGALRYTARRDEIYTAAIALIKQQPLVGYGLAGDCVQLGRFFRVSESEYGGMYAHNIVLALIMHFGLFVGIGLFVLYFYLIIRAIRGLKEDNPKKDVLWLMVILTGIQTMITGNYLTLIGVWIVLGMVLNKRGSENRTCIHMSFGKE